MARDAFLNDAKLEYQDDVDVPRTLQDFIDSICNLPLKEIHQLVREMRKNGMDTFLADPNIHQPHILLEIIMPEGKSNLIITKNKALAKKARDRARELMSTAPAPLLWKRPNINYYHKIRRM